MDHLKHQKYKKKWFETNFKAIDISINYMDEFERKNYQRREHLQERFGMIGAVGSVTIFLSL